ncbi:glycosyltransferase [Streptomyces decoyicus]|uniref:glycosyltransferase n=1 Tax=Streptomyces decoyicus TaxID=249567 RepID=UPI00069F34AB|nr:glycosyltransferase [Streptomyces decoyicus]KOG40134.1 glycosyl transferase [Streptomyces decoyicus]QZY14600.1 glycosyltransferase [Streptomyces decoyicus]
MNARRTTGAALRIVRIANFVTPASGGLRTALRELGAGYRAAGHEPVLIVPGPPGTGGRAGLRDEATAQGRVITVPGPELPGSGGYRMLTDRRRLQRLLDSLAPDRLEVSDRTTLRWTGEWARRARVPAVMVSHESVDGVLRTWGVPPPLARAAADRLNLRTAHAYSRVVCTTDWAAAEFTRAGARNVVRAPLGVDLAVWHPDCRSPELRRRWAGRAEVLLLLCSRLSQEKRPGRALDALAELRCRGIDATLVVAGDGPLRARLEARVRAERLPAAFLGHLADRSRLAALQAGADVALAPGPAETFGLAALEALACGTPVVASAASAPAGLVGSGGDTALDDGPSFADAVQRVLARPEPARRAAARRRAEGYGWQPAIDAFLAAHDAPAPLGRPVAASSSPSPAGPPGGW